jgi:hypothetical protein
MALRSFKKITALKGLRYCYSQHHELCFVILFRSAAKVRLLSNAVALSRYPFAKSGCMAKLYSSKQLLGQ